MKSIQVFWLLFVSAVWGASHSLIRITVPEWGSEVTTFLRIAIAAVVLMILLRFKNQKLEWKKNWKPFLIVGVFNASFPIFLFAYAAKTLPASYLVILNAATPIFNAIFSSVFLADPFTAKKICGIALGISGIILLEQRGTIENVDFASVFAMGCAVFASFCYASCAVYLKKSKDKVNPLVLTAASNVVGAVFFLPFSLHGNWHWTWGPALPSILILGVLGSGFGFVIYYRLLEEVGAFRASLTTFILPVFGLFWSWLFLGETANFPMMIGVGMIIFAMSLFLKREQSLK